MCGGKKTHPFATETRIAEGETIRLDAQLRQEAPACRPCFGAPWAWLWLIPWLAWPILWAINQSAALLDSMVDRLLQPQIFGIAALPLLLIGAGLFLLLRDSRRDSQ